MTRGRLPWFLAGGVVLVWFATRANFVFSPEWLRWLPWACLGATSLLCAAYFRRLPVHQVFSEGALRRITRRIALPIVGIAAFSALTVGLVLPQLWTLAAGHRGALVSDVMIVPTTPEQARKEYSGKHVRCPYQLADMDIVRRSLMGQMCLSEEKFATRPAGIRAALLGRESWFGLSVTGTEPAGLAENP